MGYSLTSIYSLSPNDQHTYFVFYSGAYFEDKMDEWVDRNFNKIAGMIGPDSVIIRGINEVDFRQELLTRYRQNIEIIMMSHHDMDISHVMHRFFDDFGVITREGYWQKFFIVTDENPHKIKDESSNIFYIIPLDNVETETDIQKLVSLIITCIRENDFEKLEAYLKERYPKIPTNLLELINEVVDLKPNIAGMGIDLNAIIGKMISKRKTS